MSSKRKAPSTANSPNQDICDALLELAEWEMNVERQTFKSVAYKKAARALASLDYRYRY
jgi:DNA polymerase/3'-5' exonuclease PolX